MTKSDMSDTMNIDVKNQMYLATSAETGDTYLPNVQRRKLIETRYSTGKNDWSSAALQYLKEA